MLLTILPRELAPPKYEKNEQLKLEHLCCEKQEAFSTLRYLEIYLSRVGGYLSLEEEVIRCANCENFFPEKDAHLFSEKKRGK